MANEFQPTGNPIDLSRGTGEEPLSGRHFDTAAGLLKDQRQGQYDRNAIAQQIQAEIDASKNTLLVDFTNGSAGVMQTEIRRLNGLLSQYRLSVADVLKGKAHVLSALDTSTRRSLEKGTLNADQQLLIARLAEAIELVRVVVDVMIDIYTNSDLPAITNKVAKTLDFAGIDIRSDFGRESARGYLNEIKTYCERFAIATVASDVDQSQAEVSAEVKARLESIQFALKEQLKRNPSTTPVDLSGQKEYALADKIRAINTAIQSAIPQATILDVQDDRSLALLIARPNSNEYYQIISTIPGKATQAIDKVLKAAFKNSDFHDAIVRARQLRDDLKQALTSLLDDPELVRSKKTINYTLSTI